MNTALTTAQIVAAYNELAAALGLKPVARFADRKTAEARLAKITAEHAAEQPAPAAEVTAEEKAAVLAADVAAEQGCPACGKTADQTAGRVVERNGHQDIVDEHIAQCHCCGHTYNVNTRKPAKFSNERKRADASGAIAASWSDPEVRAARLQRTEVEVQDNTGKIVGQFKSVPAAFRALRLGTGFHKTRLEVKAAGSYVHAGFKFIEVSTVSV